MPDAREIIRESIGQIAKAAAPDALRALAAGEINMAYKLGLIDYEERDNFMALMVDTCVRRREKVRADQHARMGFKSEK